MDSQKLKAECWNFRLSLSGDLILINPSPEIVSSLNLDWIQAVANKWGKVSVRCEATGSSRTFVRSL